MCYSADELAALGLEHVRSAEPFSAALSYVQRELKAALQLLSDEFARSFSEGCALQ
jgi:hypothetical protein